MSISFNDVPNNLRVPFVAVEIDPSQAAQGPAILSYRALLIGQKTSAGDAADNSLHRVTSVEEVIDLAGRGSILHRMAVGWFAVNNATELWIGAVPDAGGGAAAEGTITVTGPATADGTIALYLGGQRVTVAVDEDDSANDIAAAIEAAIDADLDLPVTAAVTDAVVTVTFRHAGEVGNEFDMRDSYRDGEELPAGVGLEYSALSSGDTNPDLATLIAALGDTWFHVIAHPYTDSTTLGDIEDELADRFGSMRMIDGVAITSKAGTHSALTTLGDGRNSPHSCIQAQPGQNPLTPPMEFAAETAGLVAKAAANDPARPFQTLPYRHALPIKELDDRFTIAEQNLQLHDGIATSKVGPGDVVQMGRLITTYQENAAGADDTAYLDATTMFTLMYLRYSWRQRILAKYAQHKLADDGARFGPGQKVVTPKLMKGEALGWFHDMERLGLVEGYDEFKENLVVERNEADPNRLDVLLPPDLINQLIVTATRVAFRL